MAEVAVSKNLGTAGLDPTLASELAEMIPEATGSNQTHPATFRKKFISWSNTCQVPSFPEFLSS
jgi:hypothetical protein